MSFVRRLRLAIQYSIGFQQKVAKLGPGYFSCNDRQTSCTRSKAKPRQGCPDCQYTIETKQFHETLSKKMDLLPRTTRRGMRIWPLKKMLETVAEVAYLANTRKDVNPRWSVTTALFVSIYRDEIAKARTIENLSIQNEAEEAATRQRELAGGKE